MYFKYFKTFVRSGFTTCMVPKLLTEKGNYTWSNLFNLILLKATSQQSPIVGLSTINKYVCRIYSYHGDN